jgi:hypothetical protein
MRVPITASVVLAILMPEFVVGTWAADLRLPVALLFILIGATRLDAARTRQPLIAFALIGGVLFGLRIAAVTLGWHAMDRQFEEFRSAIRTLPEGIRMMTVQSAWPREAHKLDGVPEALQFRPRSAFNNLDTLAVMDRGIFVPGLFVGDTPIAISTRNAGLGATPRPPLTPEWMRIYDFVLWIDFGLAPARLPGSLSPWCKGSYFHTYRVIRQDQSYPQWIWREVARDVLIPTMLLSYLSLAIFSHPAVFNWATWPLSSWAAAETRA